MKNQSLIKALIALILIVNLLGLVSSLSLMNALFFLILAFLSYQFFRNYHKSSILLAIVIIIYGIGHLFNISLLYSNPYYADDYTLYYLVALVPVIEIATAFVIIKSYLRNKSNVIKK